MSQLEGGGGGKSGEKFSSDCGGKNKNKKTKTSSGHGFYLGTLNAGY